ncbi:MAG: hypothetical protein AAFP90_09085 [Planctomycetota bacterium]
MTAPNEGDLNKQLGRSRKMYINDVSDGGTHENPKWLLIENISGAVALPLDRSDDDFTVRATPNQKTDFGEIAFTPITFNYKKAPTDKVFDLMQYCILTNTSTEVLALDAARDVDGAKGFRGPVGIKKLDRTEPSGSGVMYAVEMKEPLVYDADGNALYFKAYQVAAAAE